MSAMMHPAANNLTRNERRLWVKDARRAWDTGKWGTWERIDTPGGVPGARGWTKDVRWVCRCKPLWSVLYRPFTVLLPGAAEPQTMIHMSITNVLDSTEVTWAQKQRIKDETVGPERLAVEVMPPASGLVDDANVYHLWVYPAGHVLPFGLVEA